jgi:hypothetical protein
VRDLLFAVIPNPVARLWRTAVRDLLFAVIPNPVVVSANGGEGSVFLGPRMKRTYCVYTLACIRRVAPTPVI